MNLAPKAALLLSTTLALGCSAAGPAAPVEPSTPVSSASSPPPAAPPASASAALPVAAEFPPPAAGLLRRYYRVHPPGDKDPRGGVPVSIDVPPEWGVKLDGLRDPEFAPCRVESPVFGRLALVSLACHADEPGEACVDRLVSLQYDKGDLAAATVEKTGPLRRWVSLDHDVKGRRQIHARLFAVDPASRNAVMCVMLLVGKDLAFSPDYKRACESLQLAPPGQHDEPPVSSPAKPRAADGGGTAAPELPNARAVTDTALGFFKAMQARDTKAAARFLPADGDCVEGSPKDRAHCKAYVAVLHKQLGALFESFPADFQPGAVELSQEVDAPGFVSVKIHAQGDDCGEGRGLMVREMNKRLVVVFGVAVPKGR
jgi:hypothetical protein